MDIYVQKNGQRQGPFPEDKIRQGIDAGEFGPADLAWMTGKASWQPLSVLINLDVTKPPPMFEIKAPADKISEGTENDEQSGVIFGPQGMSSMIPQTVPPVGNPSSLGRRSCKRCGAPYNLFSLTHAWGSGLCKSCSKIAQKPMQGPIYVGSVSTPMDALEVIRATAIMYILLGLFNIVITWMNLFDSLYLGYIMIIASLVLWIWHSRFAAVILFLIPILCTAVLISVGEWRALLALGYWNVLTVMQVAWAWKAVVATFKFQREFASISLR